MILLSAAATSTSIWGYPYRLGISLFLIGATGLIFLFFFVLTIYLERHFKGRKRGASR